MKKYILIATAVLFQFSTQAREEQNGVGNAPAPLNTPSGVNCAQSTSTAELDINNVRAFILNGGDMWWDQPGTGNARYEVPKVNDPDQLKKNSLFAGSVWIGGEDATGNIYVTAQTYRQSHYAYWPGPLVADTDTITTASDTSINYNSIPSIASEECSFWNKHFKVNRTDIDQFIEDFSTGRIASEDDLPESIFNWPAKNNPHILKKSGSAYDVDFNRELAPFKDISGPEGIPDGNYNPLFGDYPEILGDQTIWWVMNDVGNQKMFGDALEPLGGANGGEIGLELETRAFAFQTNDAINDMTFYEQKMTNKGNRTLINTYLGQWVDPDLGNFVDDYVGCDVTRGLGICYNGDDDDDGVAGYGLNPPAIGVDFFQGPLADIGDGIDNDRDGLIDEGSDGIDNNENGEIDEEDERELIEMSNFLYYNNNFEIVNGNPQTKNAFYNYLRNIWGDGSFVTYDGIDGTDQSAPRANFMFPGTTDQEYGWGVGGSPSAPVQTDPWDEVSAGNSPSDRRFLQSAGPFTLEPGQINVVTIGVVWCRAGSGGATGSIACLKAADDLAQELFDREFKDFNGPNPPTVDVVELDQEVVLSLSPSEFFIDGVKMNTESYFENDESCKECDDAAYRFQGYIVYQLKDESVSSGDIGNPDLVREVAQCDLQDGVSSLINYSALDGFEGQVGVEMVEGEDNGVFHTISIKDDLFNSGKLITNNKEYYYMVIAYASNTDPANIDRKGDQYIGSKKGIESILAIPHKTGFTQGGVIPNAEYGTGVDITSINGTGTGGNSIDYTSATESEIVTNDSIAMPTYLGGNAPISVKVYDPYNVKPGTFKIKLYSRLLFDLNASDQFEVGDEITVSNSPTDADIAPSEFDYDQDDATGYIKAFVDTFQIDVDSSFTEFVPEIRTVEYNPGTRDTVIVIVPEKEVITIDSVIDAIDTTQTPPDTSYIAVFDTTIVPSDTLVTTFNIDSLIQEADTVQREISLKKTVIEAKIVVTNNNFYGEKGTFAKHIMDLKPATRILPDGTEEEFFVYQGYDEIPLDFTSGSKVGVTYGYTLHDFFEIEDEDGNVLNPEANYRVSEFNEIILSKDNEDYGVTIQMQHGLDTEFEKFVTKGNGVMDATLDVLSGAAWLSTIDRPENLEADYWLDQSYEDRGTTIEYSFADPTGAFTRIANGSIGPFNSTKEAEKDGTTLATKKGPRYPSSRSKYAIEELPNVDVVITGLELNLLITYVYLFPLFSNITHFLMVWFVELIHSFTLKI